MLVGVRRVAAPAQKPMRTYRRKLKTDLTEKSSRISCTTPSSHPGMTHAPTALSEALRLTPDANEALRANYLHVKSMQRRDRQSCGAIRANEAARIAQINQSGACSSSDVITSGGRKSETTMEDKEIVVVCEYPELNIHLSTFTKTGINFATRLELPGRSPSHDAYSRLFCSEFHTRWKRISRTNEANFSRD